MANKESNRVFNAETSNEAMESAYQGTELQVPQDREPTPQQLLLQYLENGHFRAFESLARKELRKNPPRIDMDYVFPRPVRKTVLDIASADGLDKFVKLILSLGANPNKENKTYRGSPLHFAAKKGKAGVLEILLSHPMIKPNLRVDKRTALHLAVSWKNAECVKVLLKHNASPNIRNIDGLTPIHIAAKMVQKDVIALILKAKRAVDIDSYEDAQQRTARQIMEKLEIRDLPARLKERKTDVNDLKYFLDCNDEEGFLESFERVKLTPKEIPHLLKTAAEHNLPEVVKSLTGKTIVDKESHLATAAEIAVARGHHKVLGKLFDAGAERTGILLIRACRELESHAVRDWNRIACIRLILLELVDVRCADDEGNTALHYAARAECSEIICSLMEAGSYIGHQNALGIPPIANISPETMSRHLDDCLQKSKESSDNFDDYGIEFDYRFLVSWSSPIRTQSEYRYQNNELLVESGAVDDSNESCIEIRHFLYIANSTAYRHLLKHPILSSVLYLKWQCINPFVYANLVLYTIFYGVLNAFILSMKYGNNDAAENGNSTLNESIANETSRLVAGWKPNSALWTSTAIALVILILREMLQLVFTPWKYITSLENWLELLLIGTGIALLREAEPSVMVMAILLSVWELMILIGQNSRISTALEMYKTVLRNFVFAFYTLSKDGNGISTLDFRLLIYETIIMFSGEFGTYDELFVQYQILGRCVVVLFVLSIGMVLVNLLNGLAVSDTAEILREAELVVLVSRTKLIAYLESMIVGSPVLKKKLYRYCGRRFIQWIRINLLGFLAKNILFFPKLSPYAKIQVKPLRGDEVLSCGEAVPRNRFFKFTMDRQIITNAKEIIAKRDRVSDYERISNTSNQKFEKLEALVLNVVETVGENRKRTGR